MALKRKIEESESKNTRLSLSTPLKENIKEYLKTSGEASFPITFCDFKDMVTKSNIFVDKTLFIKDIIDRKR
jgi:hypothetical protein